MAWQFWRGRSGPKSLALDLRGSVMSVSDLGPEELDHLLIMRSGGTYAGRPVTRVRVYDPSLVTGDEGDVRTYRHLDAQHQAICFEGHVEKDGSIYMHDRRNSPSQ